MTTRVAVVRGVERVLPGELGIYAELRKYGYDVNLVCSTRAAVTEAQARMPIRRCPTPYLAGRLTQTIPGGFLVGLVSPYRYLHQYLRGFSAAVRDADVLCPVDLGHPSSYQSILERTRGKRVSVHCWENIPFNWPHNRPLAEHFEAVLDAADHFLAYTRDAERALLAMGVRAERLSQMNLGLDLDYWTPPKVAAASSAALRVLFVGRLHWSKGVHTLIEALDQLRTPVEITVAGAGGEEARLHWLVEQRRRRGNTTADRSIRFVGPQYGADLLRLRQTMDLQVAPSIPTPQWREQMNHSLLEGLACGLPAIVSHSGAVTEPVVDGENGWVVPPDHPAELAAALERAAADPTDRARRSQLARRKMEAEYELVRQGRALAEVLRTKVLPP